MKANLGTQKTSRRRKQDQKKTRKKKKREIEMAFPYYNFKKNQNKVIRET